MSEDTRLVSKVIILDDSPEFAGQIKNFCDANDLVGLKIHDSDSDVTVILNTNVDLGAIFLAEDYGSSFEDTLELAKKIHHSRPELPIALRVNEVGAFKQQPEEVQRLFCVAYSVDDMSPLRRVIDEYIFSMVYPNALVRGISEIGISSFESQFPSHEVSLETPYLVRDRIIFGEVFSLMPLESNWCRGYMMMQTEEKAILNAFEYNKEKKIDAPMGFREVNNLLGEITNLVWGAFKNRFINDDAPAPNITTQIPIVTNHNHKFISFGSENPQLCFKYRLENKDTGEAFNLYQWFVFNINWDPENFYENSASVDELVDAGELDFF